MLRLVNHLHRILIPILGFVMASTGITGRPDPPAARESSRLVRGAEVVLLNGNIWTGDLTMKPGSSASFGPHIQAVAISNGRFLAGGTHDEIKAYVDGHTKVIDLGGRLAIPGFIDDHAHFMSGGFQLLTVDLKDARSEVEFIKRLAEKAKTLPAGRWIEGGDWDEEAWPDAKLPTRWMIDSVTPNNPVFISRYDGHASLANSLAMKLAGVGKATQDVSGGVIVRDPQAGEPTGVFKDAAEGLIEKAIPRPTEAEFEEALKAGLAEARRVGVTSVEDITVGADSPNGSFTGEIQLLRRAELEGWLTCRFYAIIPISLWERLADAGVSHNMGSDFLKLGAVKAFSDGSLGSRTGWMFGDYNDDPGNHGMPLPMMQPPSKMEAAVRGANAAGIQLAVHAIGDRANAEMLDIFERVGGADPAARRFRIEHAQHVRPQDLTRFGKLGVIASMQPYHAIDDGRWAEKRIGRERAASSYAWRSMLDAGAHLAFGTDWPVAPLNPLLGIYAAVTRATLDGKNPNGWFPEQKLTLEEALTAYTAGSAYAAFQEKDKGTISPGKLADLVVLSDDLFSIPPEKIKDAHVVLTLVGGQIVYQKN